MEVKKNNFKYNYPLIKRKIVSCNLNFFLKNINSIIKKQKFFSGIFFKTHRAKYKRGNFFLEFF